MKSTNRSFAKRTLLAALLAGSGVLAASAYAVSADRSGDTPRCEPRSMQKGEGMWAAQRTAHLADLKEKLALTPAQEAAWSAFSEATQAGARQRGMNRESMREDFAKLTTPERLDRMQAMAESRQGAMQQRADATRAFYAQLTPEQQRVFDAEAMPKRHGHRHHHRFAS